MKAKVGLLFIFLMAAVYCYGQYKSYKLGDYKNPDYKRKSLDVNLNSSGNFSKNTNETNNVMKGNLGFSFNQIRNSRRVQDKTNISLTTDAGINRQNNGNEQKLRSFGTALSLNQKAHYYIVDEKFIEVSPVGNVGYNHNKNKDNSTDYLYQYRKNFSSDISVDLGTGNGRIENVTDARQAVYILSELQGKGYLKRELTHEEVDDFARKIAVIKNKRQYDARNKLIDEITNINKYLVENGYVEEDNTAEYFLSLNDNWQYGDKDERLSGSRFKFGITPSFNFYDKNLSYEDNYFSKQKSVDSRWGGGLYLDFTNEKPLNLKWQRSFNIGARSEFYRWRTRECNELLTQIYMSFAMGCYVSTRTYVEGNIAQNIYWNKTPETDVLDKKNTLSNNTKMSLKGYYYISAQVRLYGEFNLSYDFYRVMEQNSNWHDRYPASKFQLGLEFAIF